jgi:hypothetical protein
MIKRIVVGFMSLVITMLPSGPAWAWTHANSYGGRTAHTYGATAHTNAYGGSTTHAYGEGTSHTNAYGGSTSHTYGGDTTHTNTYGGTTTGAYGEGAVHTNPYGATTYASGYDHYYGGSTAAYHPPVAVNSYAAGCYNCGGWATAGAAAAGAAAGMAVGAAVGASAAAAQTQAAASNAYAAGYAAGATYAMGAIYSTLPAGCTTAQVQNESYYLCGNTWFSPFYGASGVSYRVVPTP